MPLGPFYFPRNRAQISAHGTFTCLPRTRWQRSSHGDQHFWPTCITIWVQHFEMMGGNLHVVPRYASRGSLHISQSLLGSPRRWTLTHMITVLVGNGMYLLRIDTVHHEHASLSPNAHGTMQTRGGSGGFDQQITTLNDQLQKLKEDKEKESEANINLREALKEKTSECDLLKETIEQMMEDIELKRVVDEQCRL
ncbi:hypothetical protein GIB67_008878, partial [Kingdonia uniflora]